jgi:plastocyanin
MKLYLLLILGLVIVAGCTGQSTARDSVMEDTIDDTVDDTQADDTDTVTPEPITDIPTLSVSDQQLDNGRVFIDSLFLDKPGYVVIHKDVDGSPGDVIGISDLRSGKHKHIAVPVDPRQIGGKFFAMLHYDNDNGVYDPDDDVPVTLGDSILVNSMYITEVALGSPGPRIDITEDGFSPKTVTIKAGQKIIFKNTDTVKHWPASNEHPTHTTYPGSSISKCGTAEESNIFDSCRGLENGESYSFIFVNKGGWNYHDHLNPSMKGTIKIE